MADPTLEEQQYQTQILLALGQQNIDALYYDSVNTDRIVAGIEAQTVVIQAQASEISSLKSQVESYQNAFWITAFSVCLCFGALLFRVFTRSAAAKRLLGVLLACVVSVQAFAVDPTFDSSWSTYDQNGTPYSGVLITDGGSATIQCYSYQPEFYATWTVTFHNAKGYTVGVTSSSPYNGEQTQTLIINSDEVTLTIGDYFSFFDLHFSAPVGGGEEVPYDLPDFTCPSDLEYVMLRSKIDQYFPSFSFAANQDSITYSFAPGYSSAFPLLYDINASVTMDSTKVKSGSFELDHTVYTSVFKVLIKLVLSIWAFSYCFKELRQW